MNWFSCSWPRGILIGLPKGSCCRSLDMFRRRSHAPFFTGSSSLCGRLRSEPARPLSADADRLRPLCGTPRSGSSLGDRRQSVPLDCLLGLIRILPGPLRTPVRTLGSLRFRSNSTEVSYMTSGEKSPLSRLPRCPFRCHPAFAWKSSLVASRRPVNQAPWTVLGWYRVVASPAKSTRG